MTVTLGDFEFDPVKAQDFRLNIEGASKTGKSNTMAVILEDLADATVPTLIVERIGVLTPVKKEDDRMVVVGGRNDANVDIVVPLQQVGKTVVDMMFEQSIKVIFDMQTYDGYEDGKSSEHLAVAKVLKELNRRIEENFKSGNRLKCLVVMDEIHVLAPESGAKHIVVDDYVKRCTAQVVKLYTEGGNKGANVIGSYQRRALTTKSVVSQGDNLVIHRLHKTDRGDAADDIGVTEEEIQELEVGEVLVYGDLTKQRVIGPTKIRKRTSPDPREQEFTLPEPSGDIADALGQIQEQVEDAKEQQSHREDRIEELEKKLQSLKEKNAKLEERNKTQDEIRDALMSISKGGNGEVSEELEQQVEELESLREERQELEQDLEHRDAQIEDLREMLDKRGDKIETLEAQVSELEEVNVVEDDIAQAARKILKKLGKIDPDEEEAHQEIRELREQMEELEENNERLEERLETARQQGGPEIEALENYKDFLQNGDVRSEIEDLKESGKASPRYIKGVLASIMRNQGWVSYKEIADNLDLKDTSNISPAASALERRKIIKKERIDGSMSVDLNVEGINEIRRAAKERRETEKTMEELDGIL